MTVSVLIIDDHELIRQGLRRAFERRSDGFQVVGEAGTVHDAARALRLLAPAVIVLDVRLPDGNGIDFARAARADHPDLGIVILTMYPGDDQPAALEAGANAFVPKDAPSDDVVAAARHAASSPRALAIRN